MTNEKKLTILGKKTSIPDSPEESRLETVENPHVGTQYVIRFTCPEFTTICPITAQPDFANIIIDYIPEKQIVESKSLKIFLSSFRSFNGFHEHCTILVAKRIISAINPIWLRIGGYWYPRGGIPIDIHWQTGAPPDNVWIPDQNIAPYRGR
tara:strand:- start:250 stop:705 length:456 start_codon:yes stop_codon:yes gene_type:complete